MTRKARTYGRKAVAEISDVFRNLNLSSPETARKTGVKDIGNETRERLQSVSGNERTHSATNSPSIAATNSPLAITTAISDGFSEPELQPTPLRPYISRKSLDKDGQHTPPPPQSSSHISSKSTRRKKTPRIQSSSTLQSVPQLPPKTLSYLFPLLSLASISQTPIPFMTWSQVWTPHVRITKIAHGTYGLVFRLSSLLHPSVYTIAKFIPLRSASGFGSRTKEFTSVPDAGREVNLLGAMAEVEGFVEFRGGGVVHGRVPEGPVREAWETQVGDGEPVSASWRKAVSFEEQLWLFLEMSDAGLDLETVTKKGIPLPDEGGSSGSQLMTKDSRSGVCQLRPPQVRHIVSSVARSLAFAEQETEFEHRDLHLGNVCVQLMKDGELTVTLIDYSLSRARLSDENLMYNDLSTDSAIFEGEGDSQYDMYRHMRALVTTKEKPAGQWKRFEPRTNTIWLFHLLDKMLESIHANGTECKASDVGIVEDLRRLRTEMDPGQGMGILRRVGDVDRWLEVGREEFMREKGVVEETQILEKG